MMEKKYQLVAWTKNIKDKENARLYMIPSLESEVMDSVLDDLKWVHREENKSRGGISLDLARRAVSACRKVSRYKIFAGRLGDGIRYLFFAARYCIIQDDCNWFYYDTDLGCYSYFCGKLSQEFEMLCEEAIVLARKYGMEHILLEEKPKWILELYREHTQERRDLKRHCKKMLAWK